MADVTERTLEGAGRHRGLDPIRAEIDAGQDCLRLYRLPDTRGCEVREHGRFKATDFGSPLVL